MTTPPEVASYTRADGQRVYLCELCSDQQFPGPKAFLHHCRTAPAHTGKWCERHKLLVGTKLIMQEHFAQAPDHNICRFCDVDYSEEKPLFQHVWATHHYCFRCRLDRNQCRDNLRGYASHEEAVHGICGECGGQFSGMAALLEHRKTHQDSQSSLGYHSRQASQSSQNHHSRQTSQSPQQGYHSRQGSQTVHIANLLRPQSIHSVACPACEHIFDNVTAVMRHHELNVCPKGMTLAFVDQLAMICDPEDRLRGAGSNGQPMYTCPRCAFCSKYVSGLLAHAESKTCKFDLTSPHLTKFCGVAVAIRR